MTERYFVGSYWGDRPETLQSCGDRAHRFFQAISPVDSALARRSPGGGRNRRDDNREVIESLGYRLMVWNGAPDAEVASVSVLCGSYASSAGIVNSCVLELPVAGPTRDRLLQRGVLERLLEASVGSWDPDWGVVSSDEQRRMLQHRPTEPFVGSLLFLPLKAGLLPSLPPAVETRDLEDEGTLIALGHDLVNADNPQDVAAARSVTQVLEGARLLRSARLANEKALRR